MDYLSGWRSGFPDSFRLFSALLAEDENISVMYGVVGGALLWGVREDGASPELQEVLTGICGATGVWPVLCAVEILRSSGPLAGAQALGRMAEADGVLRARLDRLIGYFLADCLHHELLRRPPDIDVAGSVEGANIVIGGVQYVAGDLIISQTLVRPKQAVRPVAPNPPPHFAGRTAELAQLREALTHGRNVAITGIHGMGGIGKTATALQLAADMPEFGAVLWASLGPTPAVATHLVNWARHADPEFEARDGPMDVLVSRVRAALTGLVRDHCPGPVLMILDDIWEGESVAAARLLWSASPPGSVHLITTRSRLVVAQLRSTGLELRPMDPGDAVQMLRNLLSDHLNIAEADLRELAKVVGHHPLAMELAAGQVQLLERPDEDIRELVALYRRGIPTGSPFRDIRLELGEAREDNLELVLSYSYGSLDAADQARFRALGVLAYGAEFDQPLCQVIWGEVAKPALDRFRHRALVAIAPTRGWYQQHQLLRGYACALLHNDHHGRSQVEGRYADCVVDISARFAELPTRRGIELDPYLAHVEEVGALLVSATGPELAKHRPDEQILGRALSFALNTRHLLADRREIDHPEWLQAGLEVSRHRPEPGYEVLLLNEIGLYQRFHGDTPAAARTLYEAEQLAEKVCDVAGIARTHRNIGSLMLLQDPASAPQWLYRSVQLYEELDDAPELAWALLLLAEWQAQWYRTFDERAEAIETLRRTAAIAEEHGLPDVRAEAILQLGRLHDTFGERSEAGDLLADAVEQFERLRCRDREGQARLFLAGTLAVTDRLPESQVQLLAAVRLFATTGHGVGQATALRNLAQLYADDGQCGQALVAYADALPLVRKETSEFLDEDDIERFVVPGYFIVQFEEAVRLDHFAQLVAKGLTQIGKTARDPLPNDLQEYLLSETIRAATSSAEAKQDWASAIRRFVDTADGIYDSDRDFAHGLLNITLDRPASLDEGNPYVPQLSEVQARVRARRETGHEPLLPDEDIRRFAQNTVAARIFQPEHQREWASKLRANLRGARLWRDVNAAGYFNALLTALLGQPTALPRDNPYRDSLELVLDSLFKYEQLPVHILLQQTVIVRTVLPDNLPAWLTHLHDIRRSAAQRGDRHAEAFLTALIALAEGQPASMPDTNPYQADVTKAARAIAARTLLFVIIPPAVLTKLAAAVVMAKTSQPKTIDELAEHLADMTTVARGLGRYADTDLYDALGEILNGDLPQLAPRHLYEPIPGLVIDQIGGRRPDPCADQTLPESQIARLVDLTVSAQASTPEKLTDIRAYLTHYQSVLDVRGADWVHEARFVTALAGLVDGKQTLLPPGNPYEPHVRRAYNETRHLSTLRIIDGKFPPKMLGSLLSTTANLLHTIQFHKDDFQNRMPKDQAALERYLEDMLDNRLREYGLAQSQWENNLLTWQAEIMRYGTDWQHEVGLLDALIALLKSVPETGVSPDSPYFTIFRDLADTVPRLLHLPADQPLAAWGMTTAEFGDQFVDALQGKPNLLRQLDTILATTVMARTGSADRREQWEQTLRSFSTSLANHDATAAENELVHALLRLLRDEDPVLPADHPYRLHVQRVAQSIDLFHGKLTWPGSLRREQIMKLCGSTVVFLTTQQDNRDAWQQELNQFASKHADQYPSDAETRAFLNALAVMLEHRPVDLPPDNRYRAYLVAMRDAIRPSPDSVTARRPQRVRPAR